METGTEIGPKPTNQPPEYIVASTRKAGKASSGKAIVDEGELETKARLIKESEAAKAILSQGCKRQIYSRHACRSRFGYFDSTGSCTSRTFHRTLVKLQERTNCALFCALGQTLRSMFGLSN